MNERLVMLREIQELEFTAIELNLFLDTHPQDRAALRDFYTVRNQLMEAVRRYEEIYGPLTATGCSPKTQQWLWIESPWPWEIEYE
ncbi:spore coat protein CotJB [Pelotomaculum propionicicum]|uniref:spore coat protein CotJB n=1 Tax=Pelotomaculum propionicicum TaxID=258475 RepID=UPI003B80D7EF